MTTPATVPFPKMVSNLFKTKDFNNEVLGLVHAAIGIMGEAVEFDNSILSQDTDNFIEESGDLEFYIEAATQQLETLTGKPEFVRHGIEASAVGVHIARTDAWAGLVTTVAEPFLDIVKKIWVYNQHISEHEGALCKQLGRLLVELDKWYFSMGYSRAQVLAANQAKLGKRYPQGVYTDAGALARADKVEGDANV